MGFQTGIIPPVLKAVRAQRGSYPSKVRAIGGIDIIVIAGQEIRIINIKAVTILGRCIEYIVPEMDIILLGGGVYIPCVYRATSFYPIGIIEDLVSLIVVGIDSIGGGPGIRVYGIVPDFSPLVVTGIHGVYIILDIRSFGLDGVIAPFITLALIREIMVYVVWAARSGGLQMNLGMDKRAPGGVISVIGIEIIGSSETKVVILVLKSGAMSIIGPILVQIASGSLYQLDLIL